MDNFRINPIAPVRGQQQNNLPTDDNREPPPQIVLNNMAAAQPINLQNDAQQLANPGGPLEFADIMNLNFPVQQLIDPVVVRQIIGGGLQNAPQ